MDTKFKSMCEIVRYQTEYDNGRVVVEDQIAVWVTADGRRIPVKEMETGHIINCIACIEGRGKKRIPLNYLGGTLRWWMIFNQELISRT